MEILGFNSTLWVDYNFVELASSFSSSLMRKNNISAKLMPRMLAARSLIIVRVFQLVLVFVLIIACNTNQNDLKRLTNYIQSCESMEPSDLNWLPIIIKWERKTENYWIGKTILSHANKLNDTCTVLALFNQKSLEKLQFTSLSSPSNNYELSLFESLQPHNGELIKANLNSYIYPYKVWEFEGQKPFWLQVGQSSGARSGVDFYCFYWNIECLISNL